MLNSVMLAKNGKRSRNTWWKARKGWGLLIEAERRLFELIRIRQIGQEEANRLLKRLYIVPEFTSAIGIAFKEEISSDGKTISALPETTRIYFLAEADGVPELIAGLHSSANNISSIAKLVKRTDAKTRGRDCVKKLIEEVIVGRCRDVGQPVFNVNTMESREGENMFLKLQKDLPKGINQITETQYGFALFVGRDSSF